MSLPIWFQTTKSHCCLKLAAGNRVLPSWLTSSVAHQFLYPRRRSAPGKASFQVADEISLVARMSASCALAFSVCTPTSSTSLFCPTRRCKSEMNAETSASCRLDCMACLLHGRGDRIIQSFWSFFSAINLRMCTQESACLESLVNSGCPLTTVNSTLSAGRRFALSLRGLVVGDVTVVVAGVVATVWSTSVPSGLTPGLWDAWTCSSGENNLHHSHDDRIISE